MPLSNKSLPRVPVSIFALVLLTGLGSRPTLGQATTTLRVKTDTSAVQVLVDGKEVGQTPLTLRDLPSGKHTLALLKNGYEDHLEEIKVSPAQTSSIFVVMKPLNLKMPDLPVQFKAIHQHRLGTCVGVITVSAEALDYKAENDSDQFHIPIKSIKSVARSWGSVAGLAPIGIGGPTDLMAFRIEASGRSYGFMAFKDTINDPVKIASEKTRELYEVVYRLWSATLSSATAQDPRDDKSKPITKKTNAGVEVTLIETRIVQELDPDNHVALYRMGSCPPGVILPGMKLYANHGQDVIVVLLALKFPTGYKGPDFSMPVLLDAADKKYTSRNMFQAPTGMAEQLQKTGEQIRCEIPVEIPKGTHLTRMQYDDAVFDIKDRFPQ